MLDNWSRLRKIRLDGVYLVGTKLWQGQEKGLHNINA